MRISLSLKLAGNVNKRAKGRQIGFALKLAPLGPDMPTRNAPKVPSMPCPGTDANAARTKDCCIHLRRRI